MSSTSLGGAGSTMPAGSTRLRNKPFVTQSSTAQVAKPPAGSLRGGGSASSAQPSPQGQAPQKRTMEWYPTVKAKLAKIRCRCTGNCHNNCPARNHQCPNAAIDPPRVRLCQACKCMIVDCPHAARRPYGQLCFPENYGYCRTHYPHKSVTFDPQQFCNLLNA